MGLKKTKPTCFEIGCYPGTYLAVFGKFGFILSGIDIIDGADNALIKWLNKQNYSIGKIIKRDFLKYKSIQKYDVVYSLGFIEHFVDYEDIVKRHVSLVKNNGFVVITTPNFRGKLQNFLRRTLAKNSLDHHNIDSMDPNKISKILKRQGLKVIYQGYFGGFLFWAGDETMNKTQKFFSTILYYLSFLLFWLPNNESYSPYCGVIAQNRHNLRKK